MVEWEKKCFDSKLLQILVYLQLQVTRPNGIKF